MKLLLAGLAAMALGGAAQAAPRAKLDAGVVEGERAWDAAK